MDAEQLYYRVLKIVNYFLENANHLSVQVLRDFDPSVQELAKSLRSMAGVLQGLAKDGYDDQNMMINAYQCCFIMEQIAGIVVSGDDGLLNRLVSELENLASAPIALL